MADSPPLRNEADYEAALARIDALMDIDPHTPEEEREFDRLVDLVVQYESVHEPFEDPDPAVVGE